MFVYSRQEKIDIDKVLTFLRSEDGLHVNEFISNAKTICALGKYHQYSPYSLASINKFKSITFQLYCKSKS